VCDGEVGDAENNDCFVIYGLVSSLCLSVFALYNSHCSQQPNEQKHTPTSQLSESQRRLSDEWDRLEKFVIHTRLSHKIAHLSNQSHFREEKSDQQEDISERRFLLQSSMYFAAVWTEVLVIFTFFVVSVSVRIASITKSTAT
jgi:hypothetical protein